MLSDARRSVDHRRGTHFRREIAGAHNSNMERIVIFERDDLARALHHLRAQGIDHDADQSGAPVIWVHDNADAEPAARLLRTQGIRAVHQPWD